MFTVRSFQQEAILWLEKNRHVICVAPTGSGKSLVYENYCQTPGLKSLLITPLVALARQQFKKLTEQGSKVVLGSGPNGQLPDHNDHGHSTVWIVSPEKLFGENQERILMFLQSWQPDLLIVDECHCLWEWGNDFRPSFKQIPSLVHLLKITKGLWLTATLPQQARSELISQLPKNQVVSLGGFSTPKKLFIDIQRVSVPNRTNATLNWVGYQKGAGIIFTSTRTMAIRLYRLLGPLNKKVTYYHAGMSQEEKLSIENSIRENKIDIVVATSAFGMGMDFKSLNWVLLWQAPASLLSLAQAIGRVGRGDQGGTAMIFWDYDDFRLNEWMIQGSEQKRQEMIRTMNYLEQNSCARAGLHRYFEDIPLENSLCGNCGFCKRRLL